MLVILAGTVGELDEMDEQYSYAQKQLTTQAE